MRSRPALFLMALLPAFPVSAGEWRPCPACPPMVTVPAGAGVMGDGGSKFANEKPAVPVRFDRPFALSATEITFDDWRECVKAKACKGGQDDHGWGRGKRPVINVAWDEAGRYAAWIGRQAGLVCRLPTEAEWEYAARAGTTTGFWWGEEAGKGRLNCRDCQDGPHPYGSKPARSFPPNPWGLYEMNGNHWEWTADCWTPDHSRPDAAHDPACRDKVIKGGSWYYFSAMSRASARAKNDATVWSYNIGLRVLCELPAPHPTPHPAEPGEAAR